MGAGQSNLEHVLHLAVPVAAILAERDMEIGTLLDITQGTILEFDKAFDDEVQLYVADRPVAAGQVVKVGENFGLRLECIDSVADRISALGPGA